MGTTHRNSCAENRDPKRQRIFQFSVGNGNFSMMTGPWSQAICCLVVIASILFVGSFSFAQDVQTKDNNTNNETQQSSRQSDVVPKVALEQLNQQVAKFVKDDQAVGAEILVIQDGEILLHEVHGYSDKESERQWKKDTVCNIRSMSKSITSAAAQILIDRNELKLDEPVATYLESFDNDKSRAITVRQVLTHRSGLPLTNLIMPYQFKSLEAQVAAAGKKGPEHEPGSKFWYSDIGTDVVARLVEKISGETIDVFVKREIFDPLGMNNTMYGIDENDERLKSVASGYIGGPGKWSRFWKPGGKPLYPFAWGSQTIYSTTTDYSKFLQMLMNNGKIGDRQLLSEAAVARMFEPVSRMKMMGSDGDYPTGFANVNTYYGQMLVTYRDSKSDDPKNTKAQIFGHSGSDGTNSWAFPDRNIIAVYFTQSRGGRSPLTIEESVDQFIVNDGKTIQVNVPADLQPFIGDYTANFAKFKDETFTVRFRGGKLILDVPSQIPFKLLPADKDGFFAFEIVPDKSKVKFIRGEDGKVNGLELHQGSNVFELPKQTSKQADK